MLLTVSFIIFILGIIMFLLRLDVFGFYPNNIIPDKIFGYAWYWFAIAFTAIGGNIVAYIQKRNYYCAQCDQYLGNSPKVCPRCGSNRHISRKAH